MAEYETIVTKVRGTQKAPRIFIPTKYRDFMGLNIGDTVKILIKKVE